MKDRIWELDFVRGVAILFVVMFHILFDMEFIYGYTIPFEWQWLAQLAGIFILLAGVCAPFSRSCVKKGVLLGCFAMLFTLVTYIYDNEFFVQFGILHQLAFCMLMYPLFKRMKSVWLILLSIVMLVMGIQLNNSISPYPHLYIFGWADANFQSMDWFPIMPYTAYFLLGIVISRCEYSNNQSMFKFKQPLLTKPFCFIGRHTLWIYLIHQPVVMGVLELLSKK